MSKIIDVVLPQEAVVQAELPKAMTADIELNFTSGGGGAGVQSDWNEQNPSNPAYIKNKPTKLSQFENDEGFIDKSVDDLDNYYNKSQADILLHDKVSKTDTNPQSIQSKLTIKDSLTVHSESGDLSVAMQGNQAVLTAGGYQVNGVANFESSPTTSDQESYENASDNSLIRKAQVETVKSELEGKIDQEATTRQQSDATLTQAIQQEAQIRQQADEAIVGYLDQEQQMRIQGDTNLQNKITAEETARKAADTVLEEKINQEVSDRTTADSHLQNQIDELKGRGKYLTGWNARTGQPTTQPTSGLPYVYSTGDFFIVAEIASGDGINYKPSGTSYTGQASTVIETGKVAVNDTYLFDGSDWTLIHTEIPEVATFTNETLGVIKGSMLDGHVQAQVDGTGLVTGWSIVKNDILGLQNNKQDKIDETLETESTSIVGAINEVRNGLVQEGQTRANADNDIWNELETKVDRIAAQSGNPFVYGRMNTEAGGTEGKFTLSQDAISAAVVKRDGAGRINIRTNVTDTQPLQAHEAVDKAYADLAATKVKKENTTVNSDLAILLKENNTTATTTGQVYFNTYVRVNPSLGRITAPQFAESGVLLTNKYEQLTNKTSEINDESTGTQYPSAVAVKNYAVSKVSTADRVYGTDENGNQTTYDKNSFGQVDDVKVDGTSVVTDKVANIDLTGKVDKVHDAKKLYGTDENGQQTTYSANELGGYRPDLFDVKWADHILNDIQWLRADTFSWQSGDVYVACYEKLVEEATGTWTAETESGVTYRRTASGFKIATEEQENNIITAFANTGIAWFYLLDMTNKRFKLPRTKFGFEGVRDSVGRDIAESLPSHTHTRGSMNITGQIGGFCGLQIGAQDTTSYISGAFYRKTDIYGKMNNGQGDQSNGLGFNAANSWTGETSAPTNSVYKSGAPVQERATQMYLYFYVGNFTQSAIEQTAGITTEQLNQKVDKSSLRECAVVVESYRNGASWYRVYSDGWVEQGGFFGKNVSAWTSTEIYLLKPYYDTNYEMICLGNWSDAASSSCKITEKTNNRVVVTYANNLYSVQPSIWYACGQGA